MNVDPVTSPRKATSPKLAPVKVSAQVDDDDAPISSKPKSPVAASPKPSSGKPPSQDEDDKPLSAKMPKVASPKSAIVTKTPAADDDDDKPIGMKATAAAPQPASQSALSSAQPTQKPSSVATPDLASILSKVKALAAQSASAKSPGSFLPAPTSKRPKVLPDSDEDDDKPLSARASASAKPQSSTSSSKQHSSSSSKHLSSHSSHDKKKKEHDVRASPSKSRNSGALLGDAGSEFRSVGHVFLSSDRSHVDKLIAGILSRWWCVAPFCVILFDVHHACLLQVRHRVATCQLPAHS
jgi:hypothetical protein